MLCKFFDPTETVSYSVIRIFHWTEKITLKISISVYNLMYILRFESIGIRVKRIKARTICMVLNPAISYDSEETISRAVLTIK